MAARNERGSIVAGAFWMIALSVLLFWLPVIGPLIAGYVGGRQAGSLGGALLAALLPALLVALLVFIVSGFIALPLLGLTAGVALAVWIAVDSLPLLVGAAIGGLTV